MGLKKSRDFDTPLNFFSIYITSRHCNISIAMQSLFSNLKRKHSLDGGSPDERDLKHTKREVSFLSPSRFPTNASSRIDIRMGPSLRDRLTGFHKPLNQV
jgi:hypothetical protein